MNELTMGCHSDSGFAHEPRALYSQMIMGESFEAKVIDGDPPPADPETPGGSVGGTWPNSALAPGAVGKASVMEGRSETLYFSAATSQAQVMLWAASPPGPGT